jgi:ATP-dependent DNA ligase
MARHVDPVAVTPTVNPWLTNKHHHDPLDGALTGASGPRVYTMSGYDWTDRYPLIVSAASKIKSAAIIDAEAAIVGPDGVTDFEALHSRERNVQAVTYAFDLMMLDGDDWRDGA